MYNYMEALNPKITLFRADFASPLQRQIGVVFAEV